MLDFADPWPAIWLTIGVAMVVTAALCLLVASFSPDWFRPRRRHQPALTSAKRAGRGHHHREPKAA